MSIQNFIKIILGVMLALCAWKDRKEKLISVKLVGFVLLIVVMLVPFSQELSFLERVLGMASGVVLLGIGKITRGQLGYGDGYIFCVTGFGIGIWENIWLLLYSFLLSFFFAVIIWIRSNFNRRQSIAFIPFVFLAYLGIMIG